MVYGRGQALVKHYTNQTLGDVRGPITIVAGKRRRLTFVECPQVPALPAPAPRWPHRWRHLDNPKNHDPLASTYLMAALALMLRRLHPVSASALPGGIHVMFPRKGKRPGPCVPPAQDMHAMLDAAKYADLVLLLIDAAFGFEMETFEFLNLLQVGRPSVTSERRSLSAKPTRDDQKKDDEGPCL